MSNCTPKPNPAPVTEVANESRFQTTNLSERGRLQYFFHAPDSELPVRDVTGRQGNGYKTEPYLEQQAENYCNTCYQTNNIIPFLESSEQYLFLFTTCRNNALEENGSRYIVGYIKKQKVLRVNDHYAVQGPVSLYHFEDSIPLEWIHENPMKIRMLKITERQTKQILQHFAKPAVKNVFSDCVEEVERLKKNGKNMAVSQPTTDESDCAGGC